MRLVPACLIVLLSVAAAGRASGEPGQAPVTVEPVIASLEAPRSVDWLNPERWKDEQIEGVKGLRLVAGTSYAQMKVCGKLPKEGPVMLVLRYYSSGKAINAGIGEWGSPSCDGAVRPAGWQTEELVFPVSAAERFLVNDRVKLLFNGGGQEGPVYSKVELIIPSKEHVLRRFRVWVRDGTDAAFELSRQPPFTELQPEEKTPPVDASAEDAARGAIPFNRSYLAFVYPASVPEKEERSLRGAVTLPPGEVDVFQFGLHALKDLDRLSAEVSGDLPKGLEVSLRWVECAPIRIGASRSTEFRVQPNRLWPQDIFPAGAVKAGATRMWYAIVRAADGLPARKHEVKIAILNHGKAVMEYALTVNVLPFTLPRKIGRTFMVTDCQMLEDDETIKDVAEHGINGFGVFDACQPVINGKVDFTLWDKYFGKYMRHGMDGAFFWFLGNPSTGNAVRDVRGAAAFEEILKGLDERVRKGSYPPQLVLSIDEAVRSGKALDASRELFGLLREKAPSLRLLQCSLDKFSNTLQYDGIADMISCNGSFFENSKWCKEKGIPLNIYSSCMASAFASRPRCSYGFFPWQAEAAVVNGWALRWSNGHPYNDLDTTITDWQAFFPNWTGGRPISSPAWEGLRQGVNDQRYLALLERLAKEGKSDGKLLEEIRQNGIGKFTEVKENVVGDTIFGNVMNSYKDLEVARAKVIAEILKAMAR